VRHQHRAAILIFVKDINDGAIALSHQAPEKTVTENLGASPVLLGRL
jgi:hypothetical protein